MAQNRFVDKKAILSRAFTCDTIMTNIQHWLRNMVRVTDDPIGDLALRRHARHVKVPFEDMSSVLRPSPHCRINML